MSGEGMISGARSVPSGELADVIAFLERRCANAATMEKRAGEIEPLAADRRRQLQVVIDELRAGMHHGCAAMAAALAEGGE